MEYDHVMGDKLNINDGFGVRALLFVLLIEMDGNGFGRSFDLDRSGVSGSAHDDLNP